MKRILLTTLGIVCTCYLFAAPGQPVAELIQRVEADVNGLNKVYIFQDSPEYYTRMRKYYNSILDEMQQIRFRELSTTEQVDYLLLQRNMRQEIKEIDLNAQAYTQVLPLVPFADDIMQMQIRRRRGDTPDAQQVAFTLNKVQQAIGTARGNAAKNTQLTAADFRKASAIVTSLQKGLQNVYDFYYNYDPQFTWWVKEPYQKVDSALSKYAAFLNFELADKADKSLDASGIKGAPIGKEALTDLLQFEMIPYSPEELVAIANREFEWCDKEMLKASAALGYGQDWKKALAKIKENYVAPGKQPELIHRLADEAIKFVEDRKLVTIPELAKESWRMFMLSREQQRFAPFFLGGASILIAYPTMDMEESAKEMSLRSNNYGFAHATVFHELIPGHNLQGYMNQRYKSYRGMFNTPFSVEGWALYWEMLLWDKGFHATPEEKIGALFWRMHRCARIIFSLNYHLGKWTPQQCIDFLVDRVGHEPFSAESEVRRSFTGGYGPLYQIAYMMGGLQLRALHAEVVASGKMTELAFHDTFLHEGAIPVEMFRAIITKQALSPSFQSQWRFAGALK
ncbi:Uncharacterized conserved protein, DUF885 familyt [Chitinophaga jiangningensis]|uniref:Uncharacterized conserved protein, DUF885 familyt n=1 Tax=Chitinophaga jiangningensis TaxID=1419482 RepID=A0A1M7MKE8_9BACT|nr:DUF885 family protein [Chitinophaga jiangningensis]SHM90915.1 Uncharacterized conserved protein, DUF885 familyt [Chitinophaga jiangningensis]